MTCNSFEYIQFGCGLCAPDGWANFDASPALRVQRWPGLGWLGRRLGPAFPRAAQFGDVIKGLPVAPGCAKLIYCSHILEHICREDLPKALRNTLTYLRPGGIFRLVLPDLEYFAREYLASADALAADRFLEQTILGVKKRPRGLMAMLRQWIGNSNHLWMWDFKSLSHELAAAGFVNIRRAVAGDNPDPQLKGLEEPGRWENQLGIECQRPA